MNKLIKKLVIGMLCGTMVFGLVACGSQNKDSKNPSSQSKEDDDMAGLTDATLGGKLAIEFKKQIKDSSDLLAIAESLSSEDFTGYVCAAMEVEEGFLNGFDEEISGFKSGVIFMPMIGSIPFVGYIFETDDVEGLKKVLTSKANPRWNVCTEAAETVCVSSGNYVFFTMCPGEDE